mgnify:CR=1 FL=1|jgi:hypothetical protein
MHQEQIKTVFWGVVGDTVISMIMGSTYIPLRGSLL